MEQDKFGPKTDGQVFGYLEGGAGTFGKIGGYQNSFKIHRGGPS
jgi:hypothetical protein